MAQVVYAGGIAPPKKVAFPPHTQEQQSNKQQLPADAHLSDLCWADATNHKDEHC
jgi:hypothetical protein